MSFDLFDYPGTITKVDVTKGYTNQSTGEWVPESTIETEINAHITDVTLKERHYIDAAVLEKGVRKLSCDSSAGVIVGDRVKITEEDSSESEWIVDSKLAESNLLKQYVNVSRSSFLLVRK